MFFHSVVLALVSLASVEARRLLNTHSTPPIISLVDLSPSLPRGGNITHLPDGIPANSIGSKSSLTNNTAVTPSNAASSSPSAASVSNTLSSAYGTSIVAAPTVRPFKGSGLSVDSSATLLLCTALDCTQCFGILLGALPHGTCITLDVGAANSEFAFISVAISQPGSVGLPYSVIVGPEGCDTFAAIPQVNTCFNIPDGPYVDSGLIDG